MTTELVVQVQAQPLELVVDAHEAVVPVDTSPLQVVVEAQETVVKLDPSVGALLEAIAIEKARAEGAEAALRAHLNRARTKFYLEDYEAVGDGVADDSDAWDACLAEAMPVNGIIELGSKTYGISRKHHLVGEDDMIGHAVTVVGQGVATDISLLGDQGSIVRALTAEAMLIWGDVPTGPGLAGVTHYGGRPGISHGFTFDGNLTGSLGIQIGVSVAYGTWLNIHTTRCDGDGWLITSQNCIFIGCYGDQNSGNGWTFDFGAMQNTFINCHGVHNDGWNMQARQTGGMDWSVVDYPQNNTFINCIVENPGADDFANTGLGGFHVREGTGFVWNNTFMTTDPGDGKPSLLLTPSTANGYVGQNTVRDCLIEKIYIDANDGAGVAQPMGATREPLVLAGWNNINEIVNGSTDFIYDDGQGPPVDYTAEGTGAAAAMRHAHFAKSAGADLLELFNSAGHLRAIVTEDGSVGARLGSAQQMVMGEAFGVGGIFFGNDFTPSITNPAGNTLYILGKWLAQADAAGTTPLVAKGTTSQTADLFEAQNSAGAILHSVDKDGIPRWNAAATQQTTVGAAGGAAAPPAAPAKWLKVKDAAGTTYVIPAYPAT